ncbi:hypothetical protein HV400_12960 [Bacillus sporothermodurans]|nr:hypothetical protein [Heyndrickxia sporothermodurans]
MEIIVLITSIVSLISSFIGLTTSIITLKRLTIEQKEKNPKSVPTTKDSK